MLNSKIEKIKIELKKHPSSLFLVLKKENIGYLTSISVEDGVLVISEEKQYLVVTPMLFEEVKEQIQNDIILIKSSDIVKGISQVIKKENAKNVLFETDISYNYFLFFQNKLKNINLVSKSLLVENLRSKKDETEIEKIKTSCKIASSGYKYLLSIISPNRTEKEVKDKFEFYLKNKCGAEKIAFDTIVASGIRSAYPHAKTTNIKIEKGMPVIVDWGVMQDSYCCDITRTFFVGNASAEHKKIYNVVYDAQQRVLENIKDGVSCKKLNKIVFTLFEEKNMLKYYIHGLGHGIGREVHEMPRLSKKSNLVLRENMVITIEPGLYIPGVGGVRIEDTVVVKKDGCEVLTNIPKKIVEIE